MTVAFRPSQQITVNVYEQCSTTGSGNGADAIVFRNQHGNTGVSMPFNYGVCEDLHTFYGNPGAGKVYLRFDVSNMPLPILEAELNLFTEFPTYYITPTTFEVYGLNNGHPGESWDRRGFL